MSDLLIHGMELPKEGFIEVLVWEDGRVQQTGQSFRVDGHDYYAPYAGETPNEYTAVPAPPHGRLIDQDKILREAIRGDYPNQWVDKNELLRLFRNAPTIIPASE